MLTDTQTTVSFKHFKIKIAQCLYKRRFYWSSCELRVQVRNQEIDASNMSNMN